MTRSHHSRRLNAHGAESMDTGRATAPSLGTRMGQTRGSRLLTNNSNQPPHRKTLDNCNERGHFSSSCPKRSLYCGRSEGGDGSDRARRQGTVNRVYCTDILVDTGAPQTLVRKDQVEGDDILDGEVTICCAHGDTTSYPLAVVKINLGGEDIVTTAAVSIGCWCKPFPNR